MVAELTSADEPERLTVKEKWQGAVTDGSGFVAVPLALLRLQTKYHLTPTEMLVIINLLAHWWDPARSVFPRTTTVAKRMGVDKRTVQRAINKAAGLGLLTKETLADGKRAYDFRPLAKRLARDVTLSYSLHGEESLHG